MVEERRTALQSGQHAGHVDLLEEVVRQVEVDVVRERPRQRVGVGQRQPGVLLPELVQARGRAAQPGADHRHRDDAAQLLPVALRPVAQQRTRVGKADAVARQQALGAAGGARLALQLLPQVAVVAGQQLVAAVAGQHHRHVPARRVRQQVGGHHRIVGERLVEVREQLPEGLGEAQPRAQFAMTRAAQFGHRERPGPLVQTAIHAEGEGVDRLGPVLGGVDRDGRRIETARQEHAERHVGHELRAHGLLEVQAQARDGLGFGHRPVDLQVGLPVRPDRETGVVVPQQVARRQLAHALPDGQRRRHVHRVEIESQRQPVDAEPLAQQRRDSLQLRGQDQGVAILVVDQRLLPQAVARRQQRAAALVADDEGEHADQMGAQVFAVLLVEVHQHLGVRLRTEAVPPQLELCAHLAVVVDLAVEDRRDRAVLVELRLVAGLQVDDRQARVAEPGLAVDGRGDRVGPPVAKSGEQRVQALRHDGDGRLCGCGATDMSAEDSTHDRCSRCACAIGAAVDRGSCPAGRRTVMTSDTFACCVM